MQCLKTAKHEKVDSAASPQNHGKQHQQPEIKISLIVLGGIRDEFYEVVEELDEVKETVDYLLKIAKANVDRINEILEGSK